MARRPSAGVAASSSVSRVRPCTPTQAAGCSATSPIGPGIAHTLPQGFQGNPVATNWRARSASTQAPASTATRRQPGRAHQATAQGTAMNSASTAASAGTASGTSHQNRAASNRIASVIQYSPTKWWPKPKQKPRQPASRARGAAADQGEQPGHREQQHRNGMHGRQRGGREHAEAKGRRRGAPAAQC